MTSATPANTVDSSASPLLRTALSDLHEASGARMVPFAGYSMPVQYPAGIIAEHMWTRESAGLFDVSHMGQAKLIAGDGNHGTVALAFEKLVPADILNLAPGQQRYTQLLTADGGIFDDLMVSRPADSGQVGALMLIVNAARKIEDFALIEAALPDGVRLERLPDNALIALQGPRAAQVLGRFVAAAPAMAFMTAGRHDFGTGAASVECLISRSGYTGEDGYEISMQAAAAVSVWNALAGDPLVKPVGLGARDSLRLEAGLCLYGHDIDETTSPVEAGLQWSIQKRRRQEGGFPGVARIQRELSQGPARRRIGLMLEGRQPGREGAGIAAADGAIVGTVTSGGFSPVLGRPIAMGYAGPDHAAKDTALSVLVRGKPLPAAVTPMPFVPSRYYKP